jgi:hypothetical protein
MIMIPNVAKHFFLSLVLVPVPTSRCQLRSGLQEPNPELLGLTLRTGYPHNTGQTLLKNEINSYTN